MCGRFTLSNADRLNNLLLELQWKEHFEPRYNIAPTQLIAAIRFAEGKWEVGAMRWGLIPSWSETSAGGPPLINARCESIAEKPSFRSAFKKRRCLIPADGFFEWKTTKASKIPHWIHRPDREPFCFAGLWESWTDDAGTPIESCTIVTTRSNETLRPLHERMPVIVPVEKYGEWVDCSRNATDLAPLFEPSPEDLLTYFPVNKAANNVRIDTPQCIEQAEEPPRQLRLWDE